MTTVNIEQDDHPDVVVELREPYIAAILAWLWPGAGHFYQRRFAKGFIFMICILGIFFVGLGLGRGRCVYASWKENDKRWQFFFQMGVGAPAFPALMQYAKTRDGGDPLFVMAERYPGDQTFGAQQFTIIKNKDDYKSDLPTIKDGFMAAPAGVIDPDNMDTLGAWHAEMGNLFEIGTLYCIVAGLLNLLAVYDAFAGPAIMRKKKTGDGSDSEDGDAEPGHDSKAKTGEESDSADEATAGEKERKGPEPRNKPKRRKKSPGKK